MNIESKENFIIQVIRFLSPIFIAILAGLIIYYLSHTFSKNLEINKQNIKEEYIQSNKERIQSDVNTIYNHLIDHAEESNKFLKTNIKTHVYNAHSIMTSIYNEFKDIKSKEEITKIIKTALQNVRFNNDRGYYFIYDLKATSIFHPIKPQREGKNYFYEKDVTGVYRNQIAVNIVKTQREGFFNWFFHKPNSTKKEYEKIGFVKKFEPYDWFIGTGEYVEDSNNELRQEGLSHIKEIGYKESGYIFVLDTNGTILSSINPELEGVNIFKTDKEELLNLGFKDFITSKDNSTFVEYEIGNVLKNDNKYIKISYLKRIKEYDWIIGTGFNLNNVNSLIKQKQTDLEKDHKARLYGILFSALLVIILLLIISFFISKYVEKRFLQYKEAILKNEKIKFESMMKIQKSVFNNLPMMIIYKDTKNNIITVNEQAAKSLNMTVEELTNVHSKKIFPNDYEEYYKDDLEIIKSKKPKLAYVERYESTENFKVVESSKVPLFDEKGEVENIIVFIVDITEKEIMREESQRKETLLYQQSKLASMGEMIANIAHQWRQPLSAIATASTGVKLQKEMDCLSNEQLFTSLDSINDSAQYLSQTIDDFRTFFQPNKNKYSEFYISSPIEKTLKLIFSKFQMENIEIIKELEDIKISSLENELIQVLINILNNAYDELIKKEDRKLIFIKTYQKNNLLFIEIKDNANGIKEDIIARIFEAYFTTKNEEEGTGIGLYMTKDILTKLLNGNINIKNETYIYEDIEYTGANFIIDLPLYTK